jgi:bifunctional non-homologous end joining protein LigD
VAIVGKGSGPPKWIKPQLTRVADEAPAGDDWLHEIKYDGYRMHARLDRGKVQLLTRAGRDWSLRYPRTIEMLPSLTAKTAKSTENCAPLALMALNASRAESIIFSRHEGFRGANINRGLIWYSSTHRSTIFTPTSDQRQQRCLRTFSSSCNISYFTRVLGQV